MSGQAFSVMSPPDGRVPAAPQRLYINGRFLAQETTGVQRFAREIVSAWDEMIGSGDINPRELTIRVLAPRDGDPSFRLSHIEVAKVGRATGRFWEQLELPRYARDGTLFSPCTVGPVFQRNHVVAIHDVIFLDMPENFTWSFRRWYGVLIPVLCRNASRIVTVSQFSRERLTRRLGLPTPRIAVVTEGAEHILRAPADPEVLSRLGLNPRAFILAVGSLKPVKNFKTVIAAWELLSDLDLDLVVAGSADPRLFGNPRLEPRPGMHLIGRAEDSVLRALYENALCLAIPSFMEGFGLPIVEAMACGCPVVTSPTGAIPEIAGDAALYSDPTNPEDLAGRIRALVADQDLRASLRAAGFGRVRMFTWRDSARAVLDALRISSEAAEHPGRT